MGATSLANAKHIMRRGDPIVVYGSRKERDEMTWDRGGGSFDLVLRWAYENEYSIIPCACVGRRDIVDMVYKIGSKRESSTTVASAAMRRLMEKEKKKIWYWFGEPMTLAELSERVKSL